ncbi:MAG: histidine kinase [Salegentibacter sp.]
MPFYKTNKLFLFFLLWLNVAFSQKYPGRNYTAATELPNNTVRSLLVDSNNVLWIGTDNGVVRKENDVFKNYFEEDGLALNNCWAIAEDENEHIWFGSYGAGVSIYDGNNFRVISKKDGLVHNQITQLFSYGKNMYIGTSDGVSVIDINTLQVFSFDPPTGKDLLRVMGFFEYRKEIYVATYQTGIFKIQEKNGRKRLVKVNDHKNIYSAFVDHDSIFSSNKGFFTKTRLGDYVKEDEAISSEERGFSILWDYAETNDHKIFAAAWGIYDTDGGIYEVTKDSLISRAADFNIPSKKVISLAYDKKFEKVFIGTLDAGLFEVKLNPQIKFHALKGKEVLGFAETKNTSAILLNDGILLKNKGKELKISLNQLKSWQENYLLNTEIPLPKHDDSFYELDYSIKAQNIGFYDLKAFRNTYWLNTNIGIFAINSSGELQRYVPLHSEEINFTDAGDLIETNPYGGARIYSDLDAFEYTHYKQEDPQTPTMVVNSLQRDGKTYFLSVFSGLYVWENGKFLSYLKNGTWKEQKLRHITGLGRNMAISNEFGDIFIVNDEGSFKILKKIPRAKIQGNTISFLKEFNGSLLIGTEKGLTIFKDKRYIFLNEEQGLKQPLLSAAVTGNILSLGTKNGFYTIKLDAVSDSKALVDDLNIKEVYINNKEFPLEQTSGKNEINLAHDENTVLLKFSTNPHPYPKKLKYQYRLNAKEEWSPPSSKPEIFLPFLPPHDYHVSVRVLDSSTGLNYTQPLTKLSILPPFWKTWWFALLITSTISMAVYSIYRLQISQTQKFEEQKGLIQKRFEETKMEALLAQMNPHFIFNAMNSIQNYIMDSDIDNATIFLGDFAKLIRLNLDHCTKPTILLIEEIEYLQSYIRIENKRLNDVVRVAFEIDSSIDPYDVEIPTMLLQTFVENVFVHAFPAGITNPTLEVSFRLLSENILQCQIEDNGIGFSGNPTKKLHQSKGVNLVKERLTLLGYDVEKAVEIISEKNGGTSVTLKLKI